MKKNNPMLNQQLKQLQDKLKRLKAKKVLSDSDKKEIKRIENWFEEFDKEL